MLTEELFKIEFIYRYEKPDLTAGFSLIQYFVLINFLLSRWLPDSSFLRKRKTHATRLKYFRINSIVWKYFIVKKRNFNTL